MSINMIFRVFFIFFIVKSSVIAGDHSHEMGREVYLRYCVGCHGENGDGKGRGARLLVVKPRDFRDGIFEYKSTPMGTLPTDEDLMRTIVRGIPGTAMPSYRLLPEQERQAVIDYIKTFSQRWERESPGSPVTIPSPPEFLGSLESIEKGRAIYSENGCAMCHGNNGDGRGVLRDTLKDKWGRPVRPRNFIRGIYEGGSSPEDIFRTLTTGIEGTPMPSYVHIPEQDRWHLVSYLLSLKRRQVE